MTKTINGVEYTPFESGKNAKELGIDLSRKFIVVGKNESFKMGEIVYLAIDDDSKKPLFTKLKGDNDRSSQNTRWISLSCVAYYDEPVKQENQKPKFKVGDKVGVVSGGIGAFGADDKIGIITEKSITAGVSNYGLRVELDDGLVWGLHKNNAKVELIQEPLNPKSSTTISFSTKSLSNTIITNIKDEAQHKRVREKLFEMGLKESGVDGDVFENYGSKSIWKVFNDGTFQQYGNYAEDPEYKHITADEFLGEEKKWIVLEKDTPRQEYIEVPKDYLGIKVNILPEASKEFWSIGTTERANQLIKDLREYKYNTPTDTRLPIVKGNKIMSNIVSFFNDLTVSAEDKELRKAGLKDGELNYTSEAREIVLNLEAKERGYKSYSDLREKIGYDRGSNASVTNLEMDALFTKFYSKLLETAKKFNKREEKK